MLTPLMCLAIFSVAASNPVVARDMNTHGAQVFAEQKCGLCHSVAGKGNVKGPLDVAGHPLLAEDIRAWITDAKGMTAKMKPARKPDMKAFTLPKADVDALVAYLSALQKK